MNNESNHVTVLNDLVKINNDRIEGYRKASENITGANPMLQSLFDQYATDSEANKNELTAQIRRLGGEIKGGTTASGKIYRAWMDVKATFGGDDPKGILKSCEGGENAANNAYKDAIESNNLDAESLAVVIKQQNKQLDAHLRIKNLTDQFSR